jgi:hypothetical protein
VRCWPTRTDTLAGSSRRQTPQANCTSNTEDGEQRQWGCPAGLRNELMLFLHLALFYGLTSTICLFDNSILNSPLDDASEMPRNNTHSHPGAASRSVKRIRSCELNTFLLPSAGLSSSALGPSAGGNVSIPSPSFDNALSTVYDQTCPRPAGVALSLATPKSSRSSSHKQGLVSTGRENRAPTQTPTATAATDSSGRERRRVGAQKARRNNRSVHSDHACAQAREPPVPVPPPCCCARCSPLQTDRAHICPSWHHVRRRRPRLGGVDVLVVPSAPRANPLVRACGGAVVLCV